MLETDQPANGQSKTVEAFPSSAACLGDKGCSQSRVGTFAGASRGNALLSSDIAGSGPSCRAASGDVLNMDQGAFLAVDRVWAELEESTFGVFPGLFAKDIGIRSVKKISQTYASS